MGYGGFIKTVVRVVVPTVVSLAGGGPLAVAISAAASTGATGGSFKEALLSGATSFAGSMIGQSVGEALGNAGSIASEATSGIGAEHITNGTLTEQLLSNVPGIENVNQPAVSLLGVDPTSAVTGGASQFSSKLPWTSIDGITSNLTSFDVFNTLKQKTIAELAGAAVGSVSGFTLEQALLAGTPESLDALKSAGFTDTAIKALTQEARNSLAQRKFDELVLNTPNPFKDDAEFRKVIAAGIERRNTGLGKTVTQQQWDSSLGGNDLGSQLLNEERDLRRTANEQRVGRDLPTDMFKPISDTKLIDQIIGEQSKPAFDYIARSEARGNLNPYGGKTARQEIETQTEDAKKRLQDISGSVQTQGRQAVGDVRSSALSAARSYNLGDELFSTDPYKKQAEDIVSSRQGSFEKDVRNLLGSEELFDPKGAIQEGGKVQGQVSGAPVALLEAIANRSLATRRDRGLGNRGSGAF
jgi:hypothetical protein